jgi:plasmid maintenance system antidote protein VapI
MTKKEKFLALVSKEPTDSLERNRERIRNRAMIRESQKIALKILLKLDEIGWKQTDLARAMFVSPQQINKIVSGKENLSIETQIKLQTILDVPILASYYEDKMKHSEEIVIVHSGEILKYDLVPPIPIESEPIVEKIPDGGMLQIAYNSFADAYKNSNDHIAA